MTPKTILLTEYEPAVFPAETIAYPTGALLHRVYGRQVDVESPSVKTAGQWQLTSQGWVGYIPLTPELAFLLQPKVPLGNLFRMLEYAYRLESFRFLEGLVQSETLTEFYERLAHVLAKRVLDRGRQGFHRAYLPQTERLTTVRGRVDVTPVARRPWVVDLECQYEEHTADIADNQILAWTLRRIAQSGLCTERSLPAVRRAYRALPATLASFEAEDCIGRLYNRLNEDYRPLHALCRFFLEHSGPGHDAGGRTTLPFLVNMARLYELFVAEWLQAHLPDGLSLQAQERIEVGRSDALTFEADLVLYDGATSAARCVLDTKYKRPDRPDPADVSQVVTYAEAKGCRQAILVYPGPLARPLDEMVGHIRVRSLVFALDNDLETAGGHFLQSLG